MESTINRKEYRRNATYNDFERTKREDNVLEKSKTNVLANQIIDSMLILIAILLLKYFEFNNEFNYIKENFASGLSYEVIEEMVNQKFNSYLNKSLDDSSFSGDENVINIPIVENINIISSGESSGEYETAIEGVNQLSDDSQNIKNNYKISNPLNGTITSKFGARVSDNPIVSSYHTGLDIGANTGTIICSAHDGIVVQAGDNGTYGKSVIIESGDLKTVYAHCSSVLVKKGDSIKVGQKIGKVGMTGNATGPHLHFEVRYQGRFVNPEDIL